MYWLRRICYKGWHTESEQVTDPSLGYFPPSLFDCYSHSVCTQVTFRITWNTTSSAGPSLYFLRYFTFFHTHLRTVFLISFPQFWTMLLQLLFHCFLFSLMPLAYNVVHWCSVKLLFIVPGWTDFWLEKNKCTYMQSIHLFTGQPAGHLILALSHFPSNTNKQAALHS